MHSFVSLGVFATVLFSTAGCGSIDSVYHAKSGDYHELSPAKGGVYITFKRHATDGMVAFFTVCRNDGKSEATCGRDTLRVARGQITGKLHGTALDVWNGDYSIFGFHPDLGKGFRDEEGPDFAIAVKDLKSRNHQCLRIHWKPSGTNWTTVQDAGVSECAWGKELG